MRHARSDYDSIQDASGKIPEEEPVFLLGATDALAPAAIMHWAHLVEINGGSPEIVKAAKMQAMRMADYGRGKAKVPDMPEGAVR